ncbi:RNA-directed DNA polymerase [Parabacteroides sp. PF5-6]|uniref:RNA-directed DNA polymerase n=1 Tax=Parabacteroides sp. PF5-6 TaxID=1742403 RepID=UPI0024071370|nr:RNA-directed DNA polymerase [Parabacteroides sp. PF5-6]MDF9829797.1 RNA-directed DNA polymerase [Parabacteroides sp. PF5-6]
MKNILGYSHIKARNFFLKGESYFNSDIPPYFIFAPLLKSISILFRGKVLSNFLLEHEDDKGNLKKKYPCDFEDVNYKFLNNKDGKYAWRPLQLIHPALYVSLVHKITEKENWKFIVERFQEFGENSKIKCYSIPIESDSELSDKAETITHWWQAIEQQSIELALQFEYTLHTDISDCYGSIYTHSVAWALHTKDIAKRERNKSSLIGNIIDKHLQGMSYGQTNGIPQGSLLMDFIAEMVLGYVDLTLSERLDDESLDEYEIIRYRDDYRIFSNNPQEAELIAKHLTEILIEMGMRLNVQKTLVSNNIIRDSIKSDKLYWMLNKRGGKSLQEHLFLIHELAEKHPNSGSLSKALNKFYNRIQKIEETNQNIPVLISILVDITFKNPRTYSVAAAILSKLLSLIDDADNQEAIISKIIAKFDKIPNTGHIQLWLQRVTIKINREQEYKELLCQKVNDQTIDIWNSEWLNDELREIIEEGLIVDEEVIEDIDRIIESEEFQLFDY